MTTAQQYNEQQTHQAAIKSQAAAKGLEIFYSANTGYTKGSSWDSVILVFGNTYHVKDTLKSNGATWSSRSKCWVFADEANFLSALAAV
jgi:hypothetical protein